MRLLKTIVGHVCAIAAVVSWIDKGPQNTRSLEVAPNSCKLPQYASSHYYRQKKHVAK